MSLPVDMVSLVLYCLQQLGVVLGVGAQTILLISFILATRDGIIEEKEAQFGRAVTHVLKWGLLFMIGSGIAITAMHITFGEFAVVETPAFVFKWLLIIVIAAVTYLIARQPYMHFFWEGVLGAHWYALFIIHIVAPLIAWADLVVLYGLWTIGFILAWVSIVYSMRAKRREFQKAPEKLVLQKVFVPEGGLGAKTFAQKVSPPPMPKPAPKPIPPPPPAPKPVPPPPPKVSVSVPHKPEELPPHVEMPKKPVPPSTPAPQKPVAKVPEKPIEDPDKNPGLPTIRVMPRTEQDVDNQMRASSVQFEQSSQ